MEFDTSLLIKYLIEELTQDELEQLMNWCNQSEENKELFSYVMKLKISHQYINFNTPDKVEKALEALNNKIDKKSVRYKLRKIIPYAALFFLLLSLGYGGWRYSQKPESYLSIVVKEGEEIKKISLDDGTIVWLNSSSSIRIPESFSLKNRKVEVKGEVYFDVKKNLPSPFLVSTDQMNVRVMGTSFNINTGADDKTIATTLVSGKVALLDKKNHLVLEMSPGEKVTYTKERKEYYVEKVDVNISTAWHLDQLTFESVTLREIVNKLSIIYDVNVNLESKKLAERRFRCVINRDESLKEVLDILKYLAHIQYRIEGDEVFISAI